MHQSCYGIKAVPTDDWICEACRHFGKEKSRLISCPLCSIRGGSLKRTAMECDNEFLKSLGIAICQNSKYVCVSTDETMETLEILKDESQMPEGHRYPEDNEEVPTAKAYVYDVNPNIYEKELVDEPSHKYIWAHMSCVHWIPEITFGNKETKYPIENLDKIDKKRFKMICSICMQKGKGCCVQCGKRQCQICFHVECARLAGLCMEVGNCQMDKEVLL